jgi:hypothetical protein
MYGSRSKKPLFFGVWASVPGLEQTEMKSASNADIKVREALLLCKLLSG